MKEYFDCFVEHNEQFKEPFERLHDCITSGNNKVSSFIVSQTLVVDDKWIEVLEPTIASIEKIAKNPRTFIKVDREILPSGRIKKTDSETIRYLSKHTSDIYDIDKFDFISPKRLNVAVTDVETAIYENRVVYALILRIENFLIMARDEVEGRIDTVDTTSLEVGSKFTVDDKSFDCNLAIKMNTDSENKQVTEKNRWVLTKIRYMLKQIRAIRRTAFCRELAEYKKITPPIAKTNLFAMHRDYKACLDCWTFLSSYAQIDCELSVATAPSPLYNRYFYDISYLVMAATLTFVYNSNEGEQDLLDINKKLRKAKPFTVSRKVDYDYNMPSAPTGQMGDLINQYYYDKMLEVLQGEREEAKQNQVNDEQRIKTTFTRLFNRLKRVERVLLEDALEIPKSNAFTGKPLERKKARATAEKEAVEKYEQMLLAFKRDLGIQTRKQKNRVDKLNKLLADITATEEKERKIAQEKALKLQLAEQQRADKAKRKQAEKERLIAEKQALLEAEREVRRLARESEKQRLTELDARHHVSGKTVIVAPVADTVAKKNIDDIQKKQENALRRACKATIKDEDVKLNKLLIEARGRLTDDEFITENIRLRQAQLASHREYMASIQRRLDDLKKSIKRKGINEVQLLQLQQEMTTKRIELSCYKGAETKKLKDIDKLQGQIDKTK